MRNAETFQVSKTWKVSFVVEIPRFCGRIGQERYILGQWEHELRAYIIRKVVGDFSGWDMDAARYDKAFAKLLKRVADGERISLEIPRDSVGMLVAILQIPGI